MSRDRRRRERGFTLLEVLIAVLLIGVLASAAVPAFRDYVARAREAVTEANLEQIENASQRYDFEHREPIGFVVDTSTDTLYDVAEADGTGLWMQLLNPTDRNGNVLGAAIDPNANSFGYGPYLVSGARPASLLLGVDADTTQQLKTSLQGTAIVVTTHTEVAYNTGTPNASSVETTLKAGTRTLSLQRACEKVDRLLEFLAEAANGKEDAVFVARGAQTFAAVDGDTKTSHYGTQRALCEAGRELRGALLTRLKDLRTYQVDRNSAEATAGPQTKSDANPRAARMIFSAIGRCTCSAWWHSLLKGESGKHAGLTNGKHGNRGQPGKDDHDDDGDDNESTSPDHWKAERRLPGDGEREGGHGAPGETTHGQPDGVGGDEGVGNGPDTPPPAAEKARAFEDFNDGEPAAPGAPGAKPADAGREKPYRP